MFVWCKEEGLKFKIGAHTIQRIIKAVGGAMKNKDWVEIRE